MAAFGLTAFAAGRAEQLALPNGELEAHVGEQATADIASRARILRHQFSGDFDAHLSPVIEATRALAVACVYLPGRELVGDGQCNAEWSFGAVVAETIAAGLAAVAGLTDPSLNVPGLMDREAILRVVMDVGRQLDRLAPHVFGGLCRAEAVVQLWGGPSDRLKVALRSICAWSLDVVGQAVGLERLNAGIVWNWGCHDPLWVLLLTKGTLALTHPSPTLECPEAAAVAAPADLAVLQASAANAVYGLASPAVAFAEIMERGEADGSVSITTRSAQLAAHRSELACAVVESQILGPLLEAAAGSASNHSAKLASFLSLLLQPDLNETPAWASESPSNHQVLLRALKASDDLRQVLDIHKVSLWTVLAAVPCEGQVPRGFLKDCCDLAFASPMMAGACANIFHSCFSGRSAKEIASMEASSLTAFCVLASNADVHPASAFAQDLARALEQLSDADRSLVISQLQRWRGPVRREALALWIERLPQMTTQAAAALIAPQPTPGPPPTPAAPPTGGSLRALLHGAPVDLCCQVDGRLLTDPIRSPDGFVFERSVLAACLNTNGGVCPITGHALTIADCCRDAALRRRAAQWAKDQRDFHRDAVAGVSSDIATMICEAAAQASALGEPPTYERLFP